METKWLDDPGRSVLIVEETREVIGQAVKDGPAWIAYDNNPALHDGQSAKRVGRFGYLKLAKEAIEKLVS